MTSQEEFLMQGHDEYFEVAQGSSTVKYRLVFLEKKNTILKPPNRERPYQKEKYIIFISRIMVKLSRTFQKTSSLSSLCFSHQSTVSSLSW